MGEPEKPLLGPWGWTEPGAPPPLDAATLRMMADQAQSIEMGRWELGDWQEVSATRFVRWMDHVTIQPIMEVWSHHGRWFWRLNLPSILASQGLTQSVANTIPRAKKDAEDAFKGVLMRNLNEEQASIALEQAAKRRAEQFRKVVMRSYDRLVEALDEPLSGDDPGFRGD